MRSYSNLLLLYGSLLQNLWLCALCLCCIVLEFMPEVVIYFIIIKGILDEIGSKPIFNI